MLTPDQEKLKEAALAATPGKWDSRESRVYLPLNAGGFDIRNSPNSEANAAYIAAANPAAILAILAQLEQVQGDALKDASDAVHLAWAQACSDAAFYVAGHCLYGETHTEAISTLRMPKFTFRGQPLPPPPEAA